MVSWYSCSLVLNSDSVSSMRLPRLPSWESLESTDRDLIHHAWPDVTHSNLRSDFKTISSEKDPKCSQDSLDQQLHRCHRRGRWLCRSSQWWCTARCNLWSPPTATGSPRFPPTSDCHSRRRFRTSRAWQQRSYLSNVCAGQGKGTERREKEKEQRKDKYNSHQTQ